MNGVLAAYAPLHEAIPLVATLVWVVAYASLFQKLRTLRSARLISLQSLFALFVGEWTQLAVLLYITITTYAQTVSVSILVCQAVACFLIAVTFQVVVQNFLTSYDAPLDSFGRMFCSLPEVSMSGRKKGSRCLHRMNFISHVKAVIAPHWLTLYILAAVCCIPVEFARRSHAVLPGPISYIETFSDIITAYALVPQLYMFHRSNPTSIPDLLGRFMFGMLIARFLNLTYWLSDRLFHGSTVMPGRGVRIATEILSMLLLADFVYFYGRGKLSARKVIGLPL